MTKNYTTSMAPEHFTHKRLRDEFKTITAMLHIYCKAHHTNHENVLCPECADLLCYAKKRLIHCPFQEGKPTCGNCKIHCYKKSMRQKIQAVMRYAGPHMIYKHPIMAIRHLFDSRRKSSRINKNL